jgi:O-antigen/teichoic acid export membrane protein
VVKLIASLALVPRYGMYGAAWSALATYTVFLSLVMYYCVKHYGYSVTGTLFVRKGDIRMMIGRSREMLS